MVIYSIQQSRVDEVPPDLKHYPVHSWNVYNECIYTVRSLVDNLRLFFCIDIMLKSRYISRLMYMYSNIILYRTSKVVW